MIQDFADGGRQPKRGEGAQPIIWPKFAEDEDENVDPPLFS